MPDEFQKASEEVHSVWNAVDELRGDVGTIKQSQAALIAKFDQVVDTIRQINGDRKTPWGVIIGAVGVLLSLVTTLGAAALAPLYLSDRYHSESLREHIASDGHPLAMQKHAAMERDVSRIDGDIAELKASVKAADDRSQDRQSEVRAEIKSLDLSLQREMRDLDSVATTKIAVLDTNLQREMRMLQEIEDAKREGMDEIVQASRNRLMVLEEELKAVTIESASQKALQDRSIREQERRTSKVYGGTGDEKAD